MALGKPSQLTSSEPPSIMVRTLQDYCCASLSVSDKNDSGVPTAVLFCHAVCVYVVSADEEKPQILIVERPLATHCARVLCQQRVSAYKTPTLCKKITHTKMSRRQYIRRCLKAIFFVKGCWRCSQMSTRENDILAPLLHTLYSLPTRHLTTPTPLNARTHTHSKASPVPNGSGNADPSITSIKRKINVAIKSNSTFNSMTCLSFW